jgi:DNA-binding transcriptional MerR regulator
VNSFSIAELQQFSGIKAHTIRIWEQRYNALQPDRTEGNTRFYDSSQLRRLLNIVSLMGADYKVSELCTMPDARLHQLLQENLKMAVSDNPIHEHFISQMVAAGLTFDEKEFNLLYAECQKRYKMREIYIHIFHPVLVRLGLMWSNESLRPAHEHFITQLIRRKILSATDTLPRPKSSNQTWLLFLPEEEFHETGILFSEFLIRLSGNHVVNLGADLPLDALKQACDSVKPTHLLTFFVRRKEKEEELAYLKKLSQQFKHQKIYIACDSSKLAGSKLGANCSLLHAVADLESALK